MAYLRDIDMFKEEGAVKCGHGRWCGELVPCTDPFAPVLTARAFCEP
jgi:hypothetical protein